MRALYWQRPTAAQVGDIGLRPEDFDADEPVVELWPENEEPIALYLQYQTQWRAGAGGAYGLDYSVIFHHLDRRGVAGEDFDDLMEAVRVIEGAALLAMSIA